MKLEPGGQRGRDDVTGPAPVTSARRPPRPGGAAPQSPGQHLCFSPLPPVFVYTLTEGLLFDRSVVKSFVNAFNKRVWAPSLCPGYTLGNQLGDRRGSSLQGVCVLLGVMLPGLVNKNTRCPVYLNVR